MVERPTWEWSVVELFDDGVADGVVVDASEADALGRTRSFTHDSSRADAGVELVLQHFSETLLVDFGRQISKVQIGRVLLSLLGQLHVLVLLLHLLERLASVLGILVVDETVALALAVLFLNDCFGRLDFTESKTNETGRRSSRCYMANSRARTTALIKVDYLLLAHLIKILISRVLVESFYVNVGLAGHQLDGSHSLLLVVVVA